MITQRKMATAAIAQEEVIAALRATDEADLAARMELCNTAYRERHGDSWPRACRSPACAWCRPLEVTRWWAGMKQWVAEASASSLAIISVSSSAGMCDAVRRLRRGLRDVRDRTARCKEQWRDVCFAGIAGGDGRALILITHEDLDRREVKDVLRKRWPEVTLGDLKQQEPTAAMSASDAADLGRCRRGIEPLRIVIMPQWGGPETHAPMIEPTLVVNLNGPGATP